jgi:hypothetical protein
MKTAPEVFWEIVYEDDRGRRRALAEEFLELRQNEEDSDWTEAQRSLIARRADAARRAKAANVGKSRPMAALEKYAASERVRDDGLSDKKIAENFRARGGRRSVTTYRRWLKKIGRR